MPMPGFFSGEWVPEPEFEALIADESEVLQDLARNAYYPGYSPQFNTCGVPTDEMKRILKMVREYRDRKAAART